MEFLLLLTPSSRFSIGVESLVKAVSSTNTGGEGCEFVLAGDGVEVETVLDISLNIGNKRKREIGTCNGG